ncbi:hypothetical protein V1514DRAFT_330901 [Lipomyces japonicus]|uniref:uncharacterized protein n=1 Tax=Lipomyces japonicus TaxID=56871 RepID=UPI0034CFDBEB
MASLRYQSQSLFNRIMPLGRQSFRRYLQTHPQSTVAIPHFDTSTTLHSRGSNSLKSQSSDIDKPLWRRHGLTNLNGNTTESDFLASLFDDENPPSKADLERALKTAKENAPTNGSQKLSSTIDRPSVKSTDVSAPPVTEKKPAERVYRKLKPRKAAMTLTPNAISHIRGLLEGPDPRLLRIGVRNRGCSGLQYHLEYVEKPGKFDEEVVQDGVRVLIDSKALFSIIGSEMDWVDDKLSNRFVFSNPNIKGECGCGESFMV